MKRLILLFLCTYLLIGCKEQEQPELQTEGQTYDVNFTVNNLRTQVEDMPQMEAIDAENSPVNYVDFFLYSMPSGELRHVVHHEKLAFYYEDEQYGVVHFRLPSGEYKLVIVASQKKLDYSDSTSYFTSYLHPGYETGDMFMKEVDFVVTGAEIIDSVKVDRIAGMIEYRLTEVSDNYVNGIDLRHTSTQDFPFDPTKPHVDGIMMLEQVSGRIIYYQTANLLYRGYILPDRSGNYHSEGYAQLQLPRGYSENKYIKGITVQPNKKVIVTGSILGHNEPYQNFYVDADTDFADSTTVSLDDLEMDYH